MADPATSNRASRESAITIPTSPPGWIAPAISQGRGMRPHAVETQNHSERLPKTRNQVLSMGEERTHFHPSAQTLIGKRKMLSPKTWRKKSAQRAPNSPSRLCVRPAFVAVFQDGSDAEYETRLRQTAKPRSNRSSPTASLSRWWRDGESSVIRRCESKIPERSLL